jgi:hypothetical protein
MFKPFARILRNRILVTCFATAMVFFSMTAFSVPTSRSLAANSIITTFYYTDSTYAVQCGAYCRNCQGQILSNGCVTPYKVTTIEPCGM